MESDQLRRQENERAWEWHLDYVAAGELLSRWSGAKEAFGRHMDTYRDVEEISGAQNAEEVRLGNEMGRLWKSFLELDSKQRTSRERYFDAMVCRQKAEAESSGTPLV